MVTRAKRPRRTTSAAAATLTALAFGTAVAWAQPTFQIADSGSGDGPDATATGDLNGDGHIDFAVANAEGNSVSIYLNNGSGGFPTSPSKKLEGSGSDPLKSPQGIAIGDVITNGGSSGKPDIVVTNFSGSKISIFRNDGSNTYTQIASQPVDRNPLGVALASLTTSGNLDVVAATKTGNSSGGVTVLLGNGDGTFIEHTGALSVDHPRRVLVEDLGCGDCDDVQTRDGKPDIAVTAQGSSSAGPAVKIFFTNGAMTQTTGITGTEVSSTFAGPNGIAAGDIDADGCLDIVTANDEGSQNRVVLHLGQCSGEPGGALANGGSSLIPLGSAANIFDVETLDFDGDGDIDIIASRTGGSGLSNDRITLLENVTPATLSFSASECVSGPAENPGDAPKGMAVGFFDADAKADWVVANRNSDSTAIFKGSSPIGCGSPAVVPVVQKASSPVAMVLCDVTNDAGTAGSDTALDVVVLDDQGSKQFLVVFANDRLGNFTQKISQEITSLGNNGSAIACGEVSGDGNRDIVLTNDGGNDNVIRCTNNANGSFNCANLNFGSMDNPGSIAIGDFDGGSGTLDICVGNVGDSSIKCRLSNGSFTTIAANPALREHPVSIAAGEFKAGVPTDIVVAPDKLNLVELLTNNGSGTGFASSNVGIGRRPEWVTAGLLDTIDSLTDVVTANRTDGTVTVLRGSGTSSGLTLVGSFSANNSPNSVAIADFDLDTIPDVVVADGRKDKVSFLGGQGDGNLDPCPQGTAACEFDAGDGAAFVQAGNLNLNDACPDIAVVGLNSGALTIMLNTTPGCVCTCPPCPQ